MSEDGQNSKPSKRRKTARACDYCRDHKLKCDFSSDEAGNPSLKCKHCIDFGIECNVSARIAPQRASAATSSTSTLPKDVRHKEPYIYRRMTVVSQTEPRYAGPTSLSQLVSAVTRKWPSRANQMMTQMDSRYGHARVEGVSGGPFLMLPQAPFPPIQPDRADLENARIDSATKRFLLSKYQRFLAQIFPILSDKESTDAVELGQENQNISSLTNVGLALLSIAAMIRDTPVKTRMALLYHLRRRRHVDISSSIETVQYLLLLCANIEILSPDTNISTGRSLNLTGLLVRMAQDLGLHRDISPLKVSKEHLNRRARIWAACCVADKWYSISYGQPCLIRPEDCDAPPPSPYLDSHEGVGQGPSEKPYEVHVEHAKLSNLIGRLMRLVFTPSGMRNTSLEEMERLKIDLDAWDMNLPPTLRMYGRKDRRNNSIAAGLLHILKVAVDFIYYRAALVSPYNTSKHASMAPLAVWESIVKRSAEAIDWIASSEGTSVLDGWSIVMYGMIQCVLVQFYAAVNGEDPGPLRQARKCLHSWGNSTDAQSHGFYETSSGEGSQTGSTPTSGDHADPDTMGKKSLTLRTKAYTVVAMLAGIAEHHITVREEAAKQEPRSDTKEKRKIVSAPGQASSEPVNGSAPSSSAMSAYNFSTVLNPGGPLAAVPLMHHGPPHNGAIHNHGSVATAIPQYNAPLQPPVFPVNSQHLFSTNTLLPGHQGAPIASPYFGEIAEVDLLTLQQWSEEILRTTPNLDILSYSQQQQQLLLHNNQQKQPHHPYP